MLPVAVTEVHQIYRVFAYTLKKELHEVESLTVQSTGLEEEVVSSLGNPSCDQEYESEKALAPWEASHLALRILGLQHHGFHSRQQGVLDSGICMIGTCGWEEFLSFQGSLRTGPKPLRAWEE